MATPHSSRVLNLIRRVDLSKASWKKQAVIKLLNVQPTAKRIRFAGRCHCKRGLQLSYHLPGVTKERRDGWEHCGFYCPHCGWGNAGARPIYTGKRVGVE